MGRQVRRRRDGHGPPSLLTTQRSGLSLMRDVDVLPVFSVSAEGGSFPWSSESTTRLTFAPFLRFRRRSLRTGSSRSEEHTSELRHGYISYAVFCLKKKKIKI